MLDVNSFKWSYLIGSLFFSYGLWFYLRLNKIFKPYLIFLHWPLVSERCTPIAKCTYVIPFYSYIFVEFHLQRITLFISIADCIQLANKYVNTDGWLWLWRYMNFGPWRLKWTQDNDTLFLLRIHFIKEMQESTSKQTKTKQY